MEYHRTIQGIFLERPNRFIAICLIDGSRQPCHVKNTGRCRELLIPGAAVILEPSQNPGRKTNYSLIAVYKGSMLVNLDSQAPNQLVWEWIQKENFFPGLTVLKREVTHGSSRFDLYAEYGTQKAFIEVKGCTLEENGTALFPDAPTERGVKHILELEACVREGFQAFLFVVIQMRPVRLFRPNDRTHSAFGQALLHASQNGVHILAYDCDVIRPASPVSALNVTIQDPVPVRLPFDA